MDLKELLGEELGMQVLEKLGDKKLGVVNDGSWIPQSKFNEKIEQINILKSDLESRDSQLNELQTSVKGNDELTAQIKALQEQNETVKSEFESKLAAQQKTAAAKLKLNGKVHDLDLALSLLDLSKVELDENGSVKVGLDEQVTALNESKSFLFVSDKEPEPIVETPKITTSVGSTVGSGSNEVDQFAYKLQEYINRK